MFNLIKQKWVEWLISVVLVVLTVLLTDHFAVKNQERTELQRQIEKKADLDYVNQQDKAMKDYADQQDKGIQDAIRQHARESERTNQATLELIKSMDSKINILINRSSK